MGDSLIYRMPMGIRLFMWPVRMDTIRFAYICNYICSVGQRLYYCLCVPWETHQKPCVLEPPQIHTCCVPLSLMEGKVLYAIGDYVIHHKVQEYSVWMPIGLGFMAIHLAHYCQYTNTIHTHCTQCVIQLLEHKADFNKTSLSGGNSVYFACKSVCYNIIFITTDIALYVGMVR